MYQRDRVCVHKLMAVAQELAAGLGHPEHCCGLSLPPSLSLHVDFNWPATPDSVSPHLETQPRDRKTFDL